MDEIIEYDRIKEVNIEEEMKSCYVDYAMSVILSLIHISEPTRQEAISYAVFCLKKKKK